jgi:hypothetical protein
VAKNNEHILRGTHIENRTVYILGRWVLRLGDPDAIGKALMEFDTNARKRLLARLLKHDPTGVPRVHLRLLY